MFFGIRDSGSGIRDPGSEIRDPRSGIRDPGWEKTRIRDPGTGIRDKHSGSATLQTCQLKVPYRGLYFGPLTITVPFKNYGFRTSPSVLLMLPHVRDHLFLIIWAELYSIIRRDTVLLRRIKTVFTCS
jgi:hypothetical protein